MMFPKKKRVKRGSLDDKLWKIFSQYIRRRDANSMGLCKCVTCHRIAHWKEMDAGHFVQRDKKATRFDPRNVSAQCKYCNRFRSGNQYEHGLAIDRRWGRGTAEMLVNLSKTKTRLTSLWYETMIEKFKQMLKELS